MQVCFDTAMQYIYSTYSLCDARGCEWLIADCKICFAHLPQLTCNNTASARKPIYVLAHAGRVDAGILQGCCKAGGSSFWCSISGGGKVVGSPMAGLNLAIIPPHDDVLTALKSKFVSYSFICCFLEWFIIQKKCLSSINFIDQWVWSLMLVGGRMSND